MKALIAFLAAAVVAASPAQEADPPVQRFELKRSAQAGEQRQYRLLSEFTLWGDTATYEAILIERVLEVLDNGNFLVETAQEDFRARFGGQEVRMEEENLPQSLTVVSPRGVPVELRGALIGEANLRLAHLAAVHLPDRPVGVGDSWTFDVPAGGGFTGAKATYTAQAEEQRAGVATIVIRFTYAEVGRDQIASSEGRVWLSKRDATIVRYEAEWRGAPIQGAPAPLDVRTSYELLPPPTGDGG
jgi:hypothetical protein